MNGFQLAFLIWSLASAMGVAVLGAMSVGRKRSRPRGAWAFGAFAITWGVQITVGAIASTLTDTSAATLAYLAFLALSLPLPYLLVEFAASQAPRGHPVASLVARSLAAGIPLAAAITLVTLPDLVFQGAVIGESGIEPAWGPLYAPAITLPYFLAFGVVLWVLSSIRASASTPRLTSRAAIHLAGLGLFVSFASANNLVYFIQAAFEFGLSLSYQFILATTLLLTLLSVLLGVREYTLARQATDPRRAREARLVAAALLLPAAWGALEAMLTLGPFPFLNTVGLWRLAGVGVLAYGVARWRVYDLPQRATRAAATATGTGAALATGAAAYGAGTVATSGATVPIVAGLVVLAAALIPSLNFARRLFGVDRARERRDLESALYGQRVDSYRAALEASLARNTYDEDQPFLAGLRERFHITPDEDRLLAHLARSSVLIARDARAWDAYERLRLLGEGGGGRTWLARDRARDRLVVLKEPLERWQLDPAAREMVLREARLAAKVRHPNVVAVEEVVEGKGSPVIVMEYLEGGNLRDLIRAKGALPWVDAKALTLDILRGVEAVHAAGIVHRDVKPSNILLDGDGSAKVADFGIAVSPGTSSDRTIMIDPFHSTIAGTLHYMAPEARGGGTPDKRADVYACAAVLHEMLYGAPPGQRSPVVVRKDLPAALPKVLAAALEDDPATRTPSARALAEALAAI